MIFYNYRNNQSKKKRTIEIYIFKTLLAVSLLAVCLFKNLLTNYKSNIVYSSICILIDHLTISSSTVFCTSLRSDTCYTYMYIIVITKIITILIAYILYNTYIEHFSLKSY